MYIFGEVGSQTRTVKTSEMTRPRFRMSMEKKEGKSSGKFGQTAAIKKNKRKIYELQILHESVRIL